MNDMTLYLTIVLVFLAGSLIAGLLGSKIEHVGAHTVTILDVVVSAVLSAYVLQSFIDGSRTKLDENVYAWPTMSSLDFSVGFLADTMTAMTVVVITSVSLMVHIYTISYMHDEKIDYQRSFSYISLFTSSMLMPIMSNSFVQLPFGWKAVGLMSYLLIGFYFKRPSAILTNPKAFLINRIGNFGFLLGIGLVLAYFSGSLCYQDVPTYLSNIQNATIQLSPGVEWSLITITCLLLFVSAMGKSAQFPLHIWLPDSMEDPTPVPALIHAAMIVTASLLVVSRVSPAYEISSTALSVVMAIGAVIVLLTGFLGVIQNNIKCVVAYSTLPQLSYTTVALGASVYSMAMFHVMAHAFFRALLLLAAGSAITDMHHDQDMRYMGSLKKYILVTWLTMLIGNLSLIGTPLLSDFYPKGSIIETAKCSTLPGGGFAYFAVLVSVLVTAFYAFRQYPMVSHGEEKWRNLPEHHSDDHGEKHHSLGKNGNPHESPLIATLPPILFTIPSAIIDYTVIEPVFYGDLFKDTISVNTGVHPTIHIMKEEFHGALAMVPHSLHSPVLYLAIADVLNTWLSCVKLPRLPAKTAQTFCPVYVLLKNKHYLDALYFGVFTKDIRALGGFFWEVGNTAVTDNGVVNGSARLAGAIAAQVRKAQTGFVYTYAVTMVFDVLVLLGMTPRGLFR